VSSKPTTQGLWAFYRFQARVLWEWRPSRLAIVRRLFLSYLVACLALAITAALLAGMTIDSLSVLLVGGGLLTALTVVTGLFLEWLLVPLPLVVVQIALGDTVTVTRRSYVHPDVLAVPPTADLEGTAHEREQGGTEAEAVTLSLLTAGPRG
jgi:hypothetical protein